MNEEELARGIVRLKTRVNQLEAEISAMQLLLNAIITTEMEVRGGTRKVQAIIERTAQTILRMENHGKTEHQVGGDKVRPILAKFFQGLPKSER